MLIIFDFATYMSILKHLKPVAAFKEGYAKAKQYWKLIVKIYLLMMLIQLVVLLPVILISGFSLYSRINNSTGIQPDIMILLSEMLLPIIFFLKLYLSFEFNERFLYNYYLYRLYKEK